jgi:acyl transferase domain-containing protein
MEPIAIIGIGCRFPGADGPEAFWQLLRDGVDAIAEVPADRWDLRAFYDPDPAAPGKMNTRWGGFLEHVDQFDPQAFWIAPREAARIDPQQRLLLEVAWEALEDAGQPIDRLGGTPTGVFIGISTNDYSWSQFGDPDQIDAYANTGNALSIAANRISFVFDLRGPSLAIDTACSSSLVAVHLACQSLWRGEATLALAGGVNLILAPEPTIGASKLGAMAPDGRCKTFDARANGYVRGEGAGIVVLKPLANALADGDPIYAAILGSAVGQDGRTNGLTAPSRQAQEAVLRAAYQQAGVSAGRVQYVEAHGTGTLLGDPIEAKALGAVLSGDGPRAQRCATGSVKTNIGHLEAAAGVAGLIKVALSLKHRAIPPSLHFQQPNPHIPFDQLGLRVQQALEPWPDAPWPALAGVSSFGFGGTNAHVVLQEAPDRIGAAPHVAATASGQAYVLPLSAHSPQALTALAQAYHDLLADEPRTEEPRTTEHGLRTTNYELRTTDYGLRTTDYDQDLHDLCYTASIRRSHHDHRIAIVGRSRAEVAAQLAAAVRGEARPGVAIGQRSLNRRCKLVFVFSGQGGQWPGMGRELLEQEPALRAALERCDNALSRYVDWSVVDVLASTDGPARFDDIEVIQPTLFAFQVALAALWRSWGIVPDAVIGHSMGEVAAAHVAGALALEDAARVIVRRSQLLARLRGQGGMALLELPQAQAQQALAPFAGQLAIAASNSNTATVVAGAPDALEQLMARLRQQNIFCRQVQVDVAAHSPQVEPLQSELVQMLEGLHAGAATTTIYSTVSGARLDGRAFDAVYWGRNLREPVQFAAAVQQALGDGHELFLEISPHPVLGSALQQGLQSRGQKGQALASMRRDQAERAGLLATLGTLYTLGQPLDWGALYPHGGQSVGLPAYPWQRSRHWLERQVTEDGAVRRGSAAGQIAPGTAGHPLLGQYMRSAAHPGTHFWEIELSCERFPYLGDHRVEGVVAVPAALTIELVLAAAASAFGPGSHALEQVAFTHMLILPEGKPQIVQLIVTRDRADTAAFEIYSRPAGPSAPQAAWTRHAQGSIRLNYSTNVQSHDTGEVQARCSEIIDGAAFYAVMHAHGLEYGPGFQGLVQVWRRDGEALGRLHLPNTLAEGRAAYHMHPALLDSGFQVLAAAVASTHPSEAICYVPVGLARLCCYAPLRGNLWAYARLHEAPATHMIEGDLVLQDAGGVVVLEALGLRLQRVGQVDLPDELPGWLYEMVWRPAPPPAPRAVAAPGRWLIFADRDGVGWRLQASLEARGAHCVIVSPGEQYRRESPTEYQLTPLAASAFRQQLQTVLIDNPGPWQGVVHLSSLASSPDTLTPADLITASTLGWAACCSWSRSWFRPAGAISRGCGW